MKQQVEGPRSIWRDEPRIIEPVSKLDSLRVLEAKARVLAKPALTAAPFFLINLSCARVHVHDLLSTMSTEQVPGMVPDPKKLRALAHPLRWRLIDLLGSERAATATRCAEVLGESVASCSYHLGILGKYGYIEHVPGQVGKEKPWRMASSNQNLFPPGLDTEGTLAAEAAVEVFLDHELARLKDRVRRHGLEPEQWQEASRMVGASTWMTAAELREISDQLMRLVLTHEERAAAPAARPPGAREVRLFAATSVAPPVVPPRPEA